MLFNFFHAIIPTMCRNHLEWRGNVLCCRRCGTVVATRYIFNNEVRIVVFNEHSDLKKVITERDDNTIIRGPDDIIGEVSFVEWEDFIRDEVRKIQSIDWHLPEMQIGEEGESDVYD